MTVFINRVIKVSDNSKKCFDVQKSDEIWLIDSGASHHITNELSDYCHTLSQTLYPTHALHMFSPVSRTF
jgi:hypothetical protein